MVSRLASPDSLCFLGCQVKAEIDESSETLRDSWLRTAADLDLLAREVTDQAAGIWGGRQVLMCHLCADVSPMCSTHKLLMCHLCAPHTHC